MTGSEGRNDLGGLARSIDALFAADPAEPSEEEASSSASIEASDPVESDATPFETREDPVELVAESHAQPADEGAGVGLPLDAEPDLSSDLPPTGSSEDEPLFEPEMAYEELVLGAPDEAEMASEEVVLGAPDEAEMASEELAFGEPDADVDAGDAGLPEGDVEVGGTGGFDAAVGASADAGGPAPPAGPEPAVPEPVDHAATEAAAVEDTDDVPREPTALSRAVDGFIAGEVPAADVVVASDEAARRRAYDDIGEQIHRLVEHSKGNDDALRLARALLSPVVQSAMVLRLGAERNETKRARSYRVYEALGPEMAVALRDGMASAEDRHARRVYIEALLAMGETSRLTIDEMAVGDNRFLARNAVDILAEIGDDAAKETVVSAVANTDLRVRRAALHGIAKLKIAGTEEIVLGRLTDDTELSVRLAAAVAAGELGIERAVRPLVAELEAASDDDTVLALLRVLGQLGDPGAVQAIEPHAVNSRIRRQSATVRIAAYNALNHIGTPHARRLLNQAVSDGDAEVKAAVKELLHMR